MEILYPYSSNSVEFLISLQWRNKSNMKPKNSPKHLDYIRVVIQFSLVLLLLSFDNVDLLKKEIH